MCAVPRGALRVVAALLVVAGCSSGGGSPKATETTGAKFSLPAGALRERVLQPSDVPSSLVPIAAQTGARDLSAIAAFSADTTAAKKSLQDHGFQSAYVVQYADPAASATVTNVVTKFATAAGAAADLQGDLQASSATGERFAVSGLGDQAGGVRGRVSTSSAVGTLITLRWRVADTTWLLAVGSAQKVDEASVRKLADKLVGR
jgi:hypothetical protein